MYLLVFGRHVGTYLDGHQHGVSKQISINLGNVSPHIFLEKNCCDLNLLERLCIFTFFCFPDSGLYWTTLVFIFIYFEWRDTGNPKFIGQVSDHTTVNWPIGKSMDRRSIITFIVKQISSVFNQLTTYDKSLYFSRFRKLH